MDLEVLAMDTRTIKPRRVGSCGRGGKEKFAWNLEARMIRGLDKGLDLSGKGCSHTKIFCAMCHKIFLMFETKSCPRITAASRTATKHA